MVQLRLAPVHVRQRLIKDAVSWKRPEVSSAAWEVPTFCACIAPTGPSLPGLLILESLYNRPPPSLRVS